MKGPLLVALISVLAAATVVIAYTSWPGSAEAHDDCDYPTKTATRPVTTGTAGVTRTVVRTQTVVRTATAPVETPEASRTPHRRRTATKTSTDTPEAATGTPESTGTPPTATPTLPPIIPPDAGNGGYWGCD